MKETVGRSVGMLSNLIRRHFSTFSSWQTRSDRFTKDLGIPCAGFDGDQADPRNFNAAQYETRVQGLVEAMEANIQAKEA